MYEFCYDYVKPEHGEKAKLCHTDSFEVYIKSNDIYKDIAEDVIDLIHQIMNKTKHCQKEKIKK